jgi:cell division septation protein DedD
MTLDQYIHQLLFFNKYVVVPKFGAFITHKKDAYFCHDKSAFYPPQKILKFNEQIHQNDGLLVDFISTTKNFPKKEALEMIEAKVLEWKDLLQKDLLELSNIGIFRLDEENGTLLFEAAVANYLTTSFGLRSLEIKPIETLPVKAIENKSQIIPIGNCQDVAANSTRRLPHLLRYAVAVAVFFIFATSSWKESQELTNGSNEQRSDTTTEVPQKRISEASFLIQNPFTGKKAIPVEEVAIPAIEEKTATELAKETPAELVKTTNYHIIAGAFKSPENAEKKTKQLIAKGYEAKIVGINKWNLTQVAYESFSTKEEASVALKNIKRKGGKGAWILTSE